MWDLELRRHWAAGEARVWNVVSLPRRFASDLLGHMKMTIMVI